MKRIIVSVTNDLSTDQRVDKVCNTLHENNFSVLLVGRKLSNSFKLDRKYNTKRINLLFNTGFLFYAEYNFRLFFFLLFSKKDILLSNDLDTLLANFLVSKIQRKKLVYDSHELFTEVPELLDKPFVKSVWLKLENWILPKLKNRYTVCQSIADIYNEKYKTDFKVVRNFPTEKEIIKGNFSFDTQEKKIILYQGAINKGRGLELMIDAMKFLENHLLVVIGSGDILTDLKQKTTQKNLTEKVHFLGRKPPKELQKLAPLADIGLSLEEDLGLNYRYALPNKIFDYIQAETPLLVSDLPEMKRVITDYDVGEIIKDRTPEKLAKQIEKILEKDFSNKLKEAKKELVWKNEEPKLLRIFKNLM
ncbi:MULTISPECIES: glycosyltransferase [Tenacibaculum]|uniref:glycosyltransferase n=1 Tax=Tenacibaculum TaxID=104267 RepID=UPI001F0AEAE1|nr:MULTISPECIES: glycosyltransferase [Tenacibaculum]MCH3881841.1 glycosyltransferase [Tenacibaculum aquimarinum]MDO6598590.1 glycosyltransferase [Tenacibaculum sp. 1_MG-2023]